MPAKPLRSEPLTVRYTRADVARLVRSDPADRGAALQRARQVVEVRATEGNPLEINARVQGSAGRPYEQRISLRTTASGRLSLTSGCTCPMASGCKHVAAVLLEALDRFTHLRADPTAPAAGRQRALNAAPAPTPIGALITQWLDAVEATRRAPSAPSERARQLIYTLALPHPPEHHAVLRLGMRQVRRIGSGQVKAFTGDLWRLVSDQPAYLTAADREIIEQLALMRVRGQRTSSGWPLSGARGVATLQALLGTGRLRVEGASDAPLRAGAPRPVRLSWRVAADGSQSLVPEITPAALLLRLDAPWYLDPVDLECGPLITAMSAAALYRALQAPRLPSAAAELVSADVVSRMAALDLPTPTALPARDLPEVAPVAGLTLVSEAQRREAGGYAPSASAWVDYVRLWFEYAGERVDLPVRAASSLVRGETLLRIPRHPAAEEAALRRLRAAGLVALAGDPSLTRNASLKHHLTLPSRAQWLDFMALTVPKLRSEGFRIEYEPGFRYHLVEVDEFVGDLTAAPEGNDWFDLELGIVVEGVRLPLAPILARLRALDPHLFSRDGLATLARGTPLIVPLDDGRFVTLPSQRLQRILAALVEVMDGLASGSGVRLNRVDAARLAHIETEAGVAWQAPASLLALAREMGGSASRRSIAPPFALRAELRPYQLAGVAWLQFLREAGLPGILADDMGLGKTVQTLAHILLEKEAGRLDRPALIVAPTSLVHNWRAEAERFTPSLRVLVLRGQGRQATFAQVAQADLVITTYPLLARDKRALLAEAFHLVVLDEAQFIKNASTQAAAVARQLSCRHRLCLTGTPLENHLGELWSQFDFLAPGLLGDSRAFARTYRTPIEKHADTDRLALLNRRLAALMLRRTKEQVASELPAKTEIVRTVEFGSRQRDLYEAIRVSMQARIRAAIQERGLAQSQIVILDALLKLRQVCCDPRLVKLDAARKVEESAKLDLLMTLLPELLDEGRRVLIFSQFTSMLALIEGELTRLGVPYLLLTGETKDRATAVARFQGGEVPVFLISLKAGGTGLNLTAADTVIHYDPWWNPAVESQATDRAHRIGQDKPVFVYKLLVMGSVEERINALQQRKARLATSILGESEARGSLLGEADIEALFEPMAG
jgi:hypothetical protein